MRYSKSVEKREKEGRSERHLQRAQASPACPSHTSITEIKRKTFYHTNSNLKHIYRSSPYRAVNTISVIKTSQLMLYREIIAVCSEIHTKHINTLCGQNVELLIVKLTGI
jgi:hypothetical protein